MNNTVPNLFHGTIHVTYQMNDKDAIFEYDVPIHSNLTMTNAVSPITAYTFDRKVKMSWGFAHGKDSTTMTVNDKFKVELVREGEDDAKDVAIMIVNAINGIIVRHHRAVCFDQVMRVIMAISEELELGFRCEDFYNEETHEDGWMIYDKDLASKTHVGEDNVFFAFDLKTARSLVHQTDGTCSYKLEQVAMIGDVGENFWADYANAYVIYGKHHPRCNGTLKVRPC